MKIALVEAEKERAFWEEKQARKLNSTNRRRRGRGKDVEESREGEDDRAALEEAQTVVRGFGGSSELSMAGPSKARIRRAGAIPPLVAILNSNTAPQVEMAAAMALTQVSQSSETNHSNP